LIIFIAHLEGYKNKLTFGCEVCGAEVRFPISVEIDGAVLNVCGNCARMGRKLKRPESGKGIPRPARKADNPELEYEVDPEYSTKVRNARERLGLSQEQLGRMINVKPSVISHVETGKLKPDLILARKLMHSLKINLLIPAGELEKK
jgi:putative transcription factor